MVDTTPDATKAAADTEPDESPDDLGVNGISSSPVMRLLSDNKLAPMSEVFLFDSQDSVIFRRQLTVFELASTAQGLLAAATNLLSDCHEHVRPVNGWGLSVDVISREVADIKSALEAFEIQLRKFDKST